MSSNPEKTKVVDSDGEKDDESDRRDIVHGLPALIVITTCESSVVVREEEEAVVVAGELATASVEEMVANEESGEKERRPKKLKTDEEVMDSGNGEMKNPKKNAAGLTHLPPRGSPKKRNMDSSVAGKEKEETRVNEEAVVAAQLVIGALEEALVEEKIDHGGSGAEIKGIPRNLKRTDEATDSGKMKRQKKKATVMSQLPPPEGSSVCKVCGKWFKSHNALCGHMNAHRHTPFQGSLPPEFIEIVKKGVIHRQNASLVRVSTGGVSSNSAANERASASGGTDSPRSKDGKGLSIDLNVKPVEEVKEDTESASAVKFDLNKSPPKDKEEETESAAGLKFDLNKSPPSDKEDKEKAK